MNGEFQRISHGGKVLKDKTAMTAERKAFRMGVEHFDDFVSSGNKIFSLL